MLTLARTVPLALCSVPSGRVGSSATSPIVTVHVGPSVPALVSFGRSSLSATTCPSFERVTVALLIVPPDLAATCARSIGTALSKTSQTVSARRNTAAGVGAANGKARRSVSPWRLTSTAIEDGGSGGGAAAAGRGGSPEATTPAGGAA